MIEINNLTTSKVNEDFLRKVIDKVLRGEKIYPIRDLKTQEKPERRQISKGVKKEVALSLALIGPGRMRKINKRYRGKNRTTDVLAFPESEVLLEKFKVGPLKKTRGLGEIVICLREVKKNAKKFAPLETLRAKKKTKDSKSLTGFGSTFEKELARVLIHGILHLLGYNHEKGEKEAEEMEKKEEYYLSEVQNNNIKI